MTKEEIIDNIARLNSETWKDREEVRTEIGKLLAVLEKALEQQPSDDCVSREQALLQLTGVNLSDKTTEELIGLFGRRIKSLPPVTPTQRWIPIITREPTEEEKKDYFEQNGEELDYMIDSPMPYNGQEVLVSGGGIVAEDIFDEDFYNFENWDIENVEAWQPLPKPYEEMRGSENE